MRLSTGKCGLYEPDEAQSRISRILILALHHSRLLQCRDRAADQLDPLFSRNRILSLIELEIGRGLGRSFKYYTLDGTPCVTPEQRTKPCVVCGKPLPPRRGSEQYVCSDKKNGSPRETRCQRVYRIACEAGIPIDEAKRYVGVGRGTKRGQKQ